MIISPEPTGSGVTVTVCSACGKFYEISYINPHTCGSTSSSFLTKSADLTPSIGRDPVRIDSLSPKPLGRQVMDQLNPSPHMPLYPFRIGPLG